MLKQNYLQLKKEKEKAVCGTLTHIHTHTAGQFCLMNTDIAHTVYCTYIKCKTFTNQLHIKRNNEPTMYAHTATVYAVTITK